VKVAVVTGSRADYGLLRPTIAALDADDRFELQLVVSAMHLSERFGATEREIEFPIAARVETATDDDAPGSLGRRIGTATSGFARTFAELRPDALVLLGDRYEMLAAALAGLGFGLPIAHLHGGELSEGSADDAMRHCITKLSHLHFVAAREYGERVCQLGEQPGHVHVTGAAALESIRSLPLLDRDALAADLGIELRSPLIAFTFHPPFVDRDEVRSQVQAVIAGVEAASPGTVIVTLPNDDPGNTTVREALLAWEGVHAFDSLGQLRYLSLLACADAMVGNSSSGLIESPAFELPAVNVGDRQRGRVTGANVIACEPADVGEALRRALDPSFRESLRGMANPYGGGNVSAHVLAALADLPGGLAGKRFLDLPDGPWRSALEFA
jgi:UDP-hydrolysing UDP-N-acetyl-D-glucosamine 2-epimerase